MNIGKNLFVVHVIFVLRRDEVSYHIVELALSTETE